MAATKFRTAVLHNDIENNKRRIGALEKSDAVQDVHISDNRKDIDKLCDIADDLQAVVIKSGVAISLGTWIVAGFGISVIALIWSLITGQATLQFK